MLHKGIEFSSKGGANKAYSALSYLANSKKKQMSMGSSFNDQVMRKTFKFVKELAEINQIVQEKQAPP